MIVKEMNLVQCFYLLFPNIMITVLSPVRVSVTQTVSDKRCAVFLCVKWSSHLISRPCTHVPLKKTCPSLAVQMLCICHADVKSTDQGEGRTSYGVRLITCTFKHLPTHMVGTNTLIYCQHQCYI